MKYLSISNCGMHQIVATACAASSANMSFRLIPRDAPIVPVKE